MATEDALRATRGDDGAVDPAMLPGAHRAARVRELQLAAMRAHFPAAAVVAALAAIATPPLWRWPLAAIGAHGGPTGPFGGGLVVPRSGDQRGQHVAAWSDKQRGGTDMDLAQQVLRVLLRGRIRVGSY